MNEKLLINPEHEKILQEVMQKAALKTDEALFLGVDTFVSSNVTQPVAFDYSQILSLQRRFKSLSLIDTLKEAEETRRIAQTPERQRAINRARRVVMERRRPREVKPERPSPPWNPISFLSVYS